MIYRMKFTQWHQIQLPRWADWIVLLLTSFIAVITAAYIHSAWVFISGYWLFRAEIGGFYYIRNEEVRNLDFPVGEYFYRLLLGHCVVALPFFLILLFFSRKRALYRWMVALIIFWTLFDFIMMPLCY